MSGGKTELLVARLKRGATFMFFGMVTGIIGLLPLLRGQVVYYHRGRGYGAPIEPGFALTVSAVLILIGLCFVASAVIGKLRAKP